MKYIPYALWLFISLPFALFSQKVTINGYVSDAESGEKLIQARVYDSRSKTGTLTNDYGFFSLSLPAAEVELIVGYSNFSTKKLTFNLQADTSLNVALKTYYELEGVEIIAEEEERIEQSTHMSSISIPIEQIKSLPALLGEVDVVKAIQLLPGVQSGNEGSTGIYVRGGGPDQNLILLDGVPLYYVSHLGGFFSVFNADAISSVKLTKGGFPARYGGRLSSVLDIRMKEGNSKELHGEGSVGIISTKLSLEGPIVKDKASFIISGRRSYLDLFSRPLSKIASGGETSFGYYFYDLNAKVNYTFSDKDRLYLSGYFGDDLARFRVKYDYESGKEETRGKLGWGNILGALRWNHLWSPKLFSNLTATYTRYRFITQIDYFDEYVDNGSPVKNEFFAQYKSGVIDWGLKWDFDYYPSSQHEIKFGANAILHNFSPGVATISVSDNQSKQDTTFGDFDTPSQEYFVYVEDNWKINPRLSLYAGLHASAYRVDDITFTSLQPRMAMRFAFSPKWAFKASYSQMAQFLHLLSNSTAGLPTDLWVPATKRVPPQQSEQFAAGIATTFGSQKIELSIEGYYKRMSNISTYQEGASFFGLTEDWQEKVATNGQGEAYGIELLLQKRTGKTTGWIGYTLSWNYREFEEINQGKRYPYRYDRRHDFSLVVSHRFNERVSLSGTWVFGSGNPITLATARYSSAFGSQEANALAWGGFWGNVVSSSSNSPIELYGNGRNGFRMRNYHRLDIGIDLTKKKKWGERTWTFGLYNAYSRQNPFFYYFRNEYDYRTQRTEEKLVQFSLFPIIPAISYRFKF